MASSQFSVIKSEGVFVLPSEPTPNHSLALSWFDKISISSVLVEMYFVYRHGQEPAKVIREALAKALVPYYPLAGRLVRSEQGTATGVVCTSDGVWFINASANCRLQDVMGRLVEHPTHSGFPKQELFPSHPNSIGMPIMMQVTQFICGGFVVGLRYDHIMADGIGMSRILKSVAEIARGLEQPTVKPVWLRELIPSPPFPQIEPGPASPLEQIVIDIPRDYIDHVKDRYVEQTGERCSTFDVSIARLWQCRIRAIGMNPNIDAYLRFAGSGHTHLSNFFPDGTGGGYYGNCVFPLRVEAPSGKVAGASIIEVVTLIRNAKKSFPDEFSKWAKGELDPYSSVAGYDSLVVSDWASLGFTEVDYGWGEPAYLAQVPAPPDLDLPPFCVMTKPPASKEGRRLYTRCIYKEHVEVFYDQMMNFFMDL